MLKQVESLAKELLSLIDPKIEVLVSENNGSYNIDLTSSDETGLLIGFRGENISSIQTVLGIILRNVTGEWVPVTVNVGDYRQKQEQKLFELADQAVQRALETNEPQPIYNLTPAQRRIVHLHLSERKDILTESQGVEPERFLVVKLK